jgi:hypothetical protein
VSRPVQAPVRSVTHRSGTGTVCVMAAEKECEESDQLPEDAPPEQAPEDDAGEARAEAEESSGVPNEQGQATGNPANAG